jgi:hypothetical protein
LTIRSRERLRLMIIMVSPAARRRLGVRAPLQRLAGIAHLPPGFHERRPKLPLRTRQARPGRGRARPADLTCRAIQLERPVLRGLGQRAQRIGAELAPNKPSLNGPVKTLLA